MPVQAATAVRRKPGGRLLAKLAILSLLATAATTTTGSRMPAHAATATEASVSQSVLQLLNVQRKAHYLPALGWSPAMVNSAHRHNLAMAAANQLSHQLPGEPAFTVRISQAGVNWHVAAENIGWTSDLTAHGAVSLENAMYNERPPADGHRLNILSASVRYIGIDTYIDSRTGKLWLTEDFADVSGPLPVSVHAPVGRLDSATVLPGHKVRLAGWAMDPDSKSTALYIGFFFDGHFGGFVRAPVARPDVSRVMGSGPYQGYLITITLPAGRHTLTTYGVNVGLGSGMTRLGAATVTL